jgi:hypothetical protein
MQMTTAPSTSLQPDPLPESWVEKLFHRMLLDYGKKFTDQWGGADADELIAHWARQMAGYSGDEIGRGLRALDGMSWPPTLPEFKKLCRPPVDPMVAFHEAQAGMLARAAGRHGEWSHPAIFWAAMRLGPDITGQLYNAVRPRWEKLLAESLERGEWSPVPAAAVALPAPGRTMLSAAVAKERLGDLQASGVLKRAPDPDRRLDWARRILADEAAGKRNVELYSLNLAKEALGLR